ncbi:MAG: biotin--[acetyl-CoA-carboxylase] ligase [Chloroflexi bacterium]|nr:biotin--[acetyl-CoA-carboxylase] ligase [Chloroflexota bacterium]MDP6421939.1 biotin--[acetyl-CoA-carboxylase] ligase [SAR202 cluster bacterium]MDP6663393.1 biotin--[acetyl-CoA-carboxylase] ligase [SAR202 cluster bacterium]MQG59356.1 biotin--[acetyl-CoA-carboxylase] ligase [SAR202 cluster bacterium]HAL49317.1 biotin--[acetyl-CoA-carboxylase] ligase [Dehalococcoidia bacterium]
MDTIVPLNIDGVRKALSGGIVGSAVHYHALLPSTMDEARRLALDGAPDGTVVIAEEQTKGRGRFSRVWVSPPGLNLALSVLLRPEIPQLPYINMAAALAVCDVVHELTDLSASIKWPNDVRIGGRKLSGILVETDMVGRQLNHAVVGIGMNVNLDPSQHPEIAEIATSILAESGREANRSEALRLLLGHLDRYYAEIRGGASLREPWAAKLETLGMTIQVRWGDDVIEGTGESVDEQGNLMVRKADGSSVTVVAGEVTLQV